MTRCVPPILLALVVLAAGCATAPSGKVIKVDDVKSVSGRWVGYATGLTAGSPDPSDLTINPDGTFTSRTRAQHQNGTVSINDGKVIFVRTGASAGSSTVSQTSTAVLEVRDGKRVLVGQGRSDSGPYSYELVEQK